jgi:hypothetical protein
MADPRPPRFVARGGGFVPAGGGFVAPGGGFVATSGEGAPPPPPTLVSIDVTPNTPSVQLGATQQMTATGTYSDASTADLTAGATWLSGTPAAATVNGTGLVTAVAVGSSLITATVGAVSGSETVSAVDNRQTIALSAPVATGSSSTDGTVFNTASFTPVVGQVYYVACAETSVAESPALNHDGFGGGFTLIGTSRIGATIRQMSVFRGVATAAVADTITMTYASTQASALWSVVTGTGINTGGSNGADSVVQSANANSNVNVTTLTTTLASFEHVNNAHLSFVFLGSNATVTPDPDFAELGDIGVTAGTGTLEAAWAVNQVACDPSWASTVVATFSIEIKAAV